MPPKRAMGVYSDYAPQMKQRRTWDAYPKPTPQPIPGPSNIAPSAIESWYNSPSGYKPEPYDSGYYDIGDGSYPSGSAGMYQESVGGGYGGKMGGGYGSDYTDAMAGYGNGVQTYGAESYGGATATGWTGDQSYSPHYNKIGRPGKKPATPAISQGNEGAPFIDEFALVSDADKQYLQSRGQDTKSFIKTLKSAMNIVQSIEGKVGLDTWEEGTGEGWGYDQSWEGYPIGRGRGRGAVSRGRGRGGGTGRGIGGAGGRGGQTGGQVFGQGMRGLFRGARGGRGFNQGIAAGQRGRGGRGQFQMQANTQRGRGQIRGGRPGFQNQIFQNMSRRGSHLAPVHSLATVQVKGGGLKLSLPENIRRFCLFCINETDKVNEIQTIENALTASKLGLQSEYTVSEVGDKMFSGALFLDGVFIARAASNRKKQAKHDCYAKALQVLRTKTVSEIMALKDDGPEASVPSEQTDMDSEVLDTDTESGPPGSCMPNSCVPGLHKLKQYLMNRQLVSTTNSYVQELEQAFSASHCGLTHNYEVDLVQTGGGKNIFRGRFYIEGILFGGAVDTQKKKTKQKMSEQAVNFIITQSVGILVRGKTLKELEIDDASLTVPEASPITDSIPVKTEMNEKEILEQLIQSIKANADPKNRINALTKVTTKMKIPITPIYHQDESGKSVECRLFVSDFLLATQFGDSVQTARNEAYHKAYEVLTESSADEIIASCRRITKDDTDDPSRFDPVPKSKKKKMDDSNLMRLKRIMNFDLEESLKINISEMVILEHSDWSIDRRRNAFCILSESALQNHMLLEWTVTKGDKLFTCTMSLQKIVLAEVSAINKASARSLAASAILFRLYETLPVIMSASKKLPDIWMQSEQLHERAQELKEQSGETGSIDGDLVDFEVETSSKNQAESEHEKMETEMSDGITNKDNAESGEKQLVQYNKWIIKYVEQLVSDYVNNDVVDELIFGSGVSIGDLKRIAAVARKYGLKFGYRTFKGQMYSSISKRLSPRQIYDLLNKGVASKRYSIVPKSELPCYKDIQQEIAEAAKVKPV